MEILKPTKFSFFRVKPLCFLLCIMISAVKSQSGLLCISDCATCPMICSSPPPLEVVSEPPPLPPLLSSEPPPTPPAPPLPPSSYISWGDSGGTTPASPSNYFDSPATETPAAGGGGLGKINYSYPYFYYYASNGVSLSSLQLHRSTFLVFLIISISSVYSC